MVEHESRGKAGVQNVTLTLPSDLLREARHLAVDRGVSLSRYLALVLEERVEAARRYQQARARHQRLLDEGLALGTGGTVARQREKLECCNLQEAIDFMITSEETGYPKPHRFMFDMALARAGCTASEAVMVGNSWSGDVVGAGQAGIRAVWFNRYGVPCPDPALALEIRSFEPVDQVLRSLLVAP